MASTKPTSNSLNGTLLSHRSDSDRNAAVLKGFVKKAESATLLAWAEQFCALGVRAQPSCSPYQD
eukprot:2219560-Amphidinium_carterae.1